MTLLGSGRLARSRRRKKYPQINADYVFKADSCVGDKQIVPKSAAFLLPGRTLSHYEICVNLRNLRIYQICGSGFNQGVKENLALRNDVPISHGSIGLETKFALICVICGYTKSVVRVLIRESKKTGPLRTMCLSPTDQSALKRNLR